MPHISIRDMSVDFVIFGAGSRSLKKAIVAQATGGRVSRSSDRAVTVRALDKINLEFKHGDRVGLIGHNGSGKSTLLRSVAGIYLPTEGVLTVEGNVSALLNPSAGMDPDATGYENIFLRGYVLGLNKKQIEGTLDEIAEFTELGEYLNLPMRTYSAGMAARLAFAISTSIHPDILLIDEGIGAGDAAFLEKMQVRLGEFVDRASILLIASHDQALLERFCTEKLIMDHGQVVERQKV
ncbi:MAG: ABC transporter ATP-binding protein [Rhizobiaceae bacterium]